MNPKEPKPTEQSPTRPVHEAVFDTLTDVAKLALQFGEVRALAIVVDWEVGAELYPYAVQMGRRGPVKRPAELMGLSRQTLKLVSQQFTEMSELLAGADELAQRLSSEISAREQALRELDGQIAWRREQLALLENAGAVGDPAAAPGPPAAAPGAVPDAVRAAPPEPGPA